MASTSDMRRALKSLLFNKVGKLVELSNACHNPAGAGGGRFCEADVGKASDAHLADQKKKAQARISKNKQDAESKKLLSAISAEQRKRSNPVPVAAPSAPASPVNSPVVPAAAGAVNKQGVKPTDANGYPKKYNGVRALQGTRHVIERAADIGLDRVLGAVEPNGKTRLENLILNGDVALYKPARTIEKQGRTIRESPVFTYDLPGYTFKLAIAIDVDHGQIRSVFPTSDAQEAKIAQWKRENRDPSYWQAKNRADIKEQVLAGSRGGA